MADVIPRIPGFAIGGGVAVSNTAILIGGAALILGTWLMMNKKPRMDEESMAQDIEADMFAYAANPRSLEHNRDRIREAINRIRDTFRVAVESYQKKVRDLHIALRQGLITNAQFQAQHKLALQEFANARKTRHKELMELLGVPRYDAHSVNVVPTLG